MLVIVILIVTSLCLAGTFLACFCWAVRSGQYDDTYTPSLRLLSDEASTGKQAPTDKLNSKPSATIV